jgi:hypothetical protein
MLAVEAEMLQIGDVDCVPYLRRAAAINPINELEVLANCRFVFLADGGLGGPRQHCDFKVKSTPHRLVDIRCDIRIFLKQICNFDPATGASSKLERLEADLEEVAASGKKAIVFSQWVKTLEGDAREAPPFRPLEYHGQIPPSSATPCWPSSRPTAAST